MHRFSPGCKCSMCHCMHAWFTSHEINPFVLHIISTVFNWSCSGKRCKFSASNRILWPSGTRKIPTPTPEVTRLLASTIFSNYTTLWILITFELTPWKYDDIIYIRTPTSALPHIGVLTLIRNFLPYGSTYIDYICVIITTCDFICKVKRFSLYLWWWKNSLYYSILRPVNLRTDDICPLQKICDKWPSDYWPLDPMTLIANDSLDQWAVTNVRIPHQGPIGLTNLGTNAPCDQCTNLRTSEPSGYRPFVPITILNTDHTTKASIFGPLILRTAGPSHYWSFGSMHDFRTNEPLDQWPLGTSSRPRPAYCTVLLLSSLLWRHNGRDGVSNHQPHDCLLNRSFRRSSKKTSKLRVTGLCARNSPVTGEFPAQMASNAENVPIWWRHHVKLYSWTGDMEALSVLWEEQ